MAIKYFANIEQYAQPVEDNHLVTKSYVDAAVSHKIKESVRAACAVNIAGTYDSTELTLTQDVGSEAAFVVDGVSLETGDRVLLFGQTDSTQNGLYYVVTNGSEESSPAAGDAVAGVLKRTEDASKGTDFVPNFMVSARQGNSFEDVAFILINDTPVTLDTTSIYFEKFKGNATVNSFYGTFTGDGSTKEFVVTHALGTKDLIIQFTDEDDVPCMFDVERTTDNTITVKSEIALESGETFHVSILA